MDVIAQNIFKAKEKNGGRVKRHFVEEEIEDMKKEFPWLNRDNVNYHKQFQIGVGIPLIAVYSQTKTSAAQ